jgi:hypothetical protein
MKRLDRYGCFNRAPFVEEYQTAHGEHIKTFSNPDCQFTLSELGRTDPRCAGCKHQGDAHGTNQ